MALTLKLLGTGQITTTSEVNITQNTQTTKALLVKNVILTNLAGTAASLEIYVKKGGAGTSWQIAPKPVTVPANGQIILDTELTLNLNSASFETLYGKFNAGSGTVDFVANGIERDV